jgi:hypothetical protein
MPNGSQTASVVSSGYWVDGEEVPNESDHQGLWHHIRNSVTLDTRKHYPYTLGSLALSSLTVCSLLPRVSCLIPAVCYLLSPVCCPVPAICCLLSAVCCLLSTVYCLLKAKVYVTNYLTYAKVVSAHFSRDPKLKRGVVLASNGFEVRNCQFGDGRGVRE